MRGVFFCVKDSVRSLHFTRRNLFLNQGVAMLSEASLIPDSITSSSVYAWCYQVKTEPSAQVVSDLRTCSEKSPDRHIVKDTKEQGYEWYALGAARPSSSESTWQYGVRMSTVVENLLVTAPSRIVPDTSRVQSSPRKRKTQVSQSFVKLPRQFEIASPPVTPQNQSLHGDPTWRLPWRRGLPVGNRTGVGRIEEPHMFFTGRCHIFKLFLLRSLLDCPSISTYLQFVDFLFILLLSNLNPQLVWTRPLYK